MKIFLDANVLISVANKEYPVFSYSSRILSLADHKQFEVFTSPLCLAITFYFAQKKNKKLARQKIGLLSKNLSITSITHETARKALANTAIHNFEDGLEYYSALESKCDCIITEDGGDFYFSDIEVLSCESFFEKYLVKR